jgi:EamA domain-containing membrane protein RarD
MVGFLNCVPSEQQVWTITAISLFGFMWNYCILLNYSSSSTYISYKVLWSVSHENSSGIVDFIDIQ